MHPPARLRLSDLADNNNNNKNSYNIRHHHRHHLNTYNMPSQLATPLPISPARGKLQLLTSQDFASLHATLTSKSVQTSPTPIHEVSVDDYYIPAPPPPSPVSFRHEKLAGRR